MSVISSKNPLVSQRLLTFLIFSETLSIKKTAERLLTSSASVSRQLSEFETELNVDLLDRQGLPFRLTPEGKYLADVFKKESYRMREELLKTQKQNAKINSLSLGALQTLCVPLLSPFFLKTGRSLGNILCLTGSSDYLLKLFLEKELDLMLVSRRFGHLPDVKVQLLYKDPMVLALPKSIAGSWRTWTLEQLKYCGLPYICFYKKSGGGGKPQADYLAALGTDYVHLIESDNTDLILSLISEGKGWGLMRPSAILSSPVSLKNIWLAPMVRRRIERGIYLIGQQTVSSDNFEWIANQLKAIYQEEVLPKVIQMAPWLTKEDLLAEASSSVKSQRK